MKPRETLDLRGVRCPLSWARAKVRIEALVTGAELELVLDDAQGARDIPRAAEAEGHHVVEVREAEGVWRLTIEV
jgi:tRNA 2-thiouridine synthesizing protein A